MQSVNALSKRRISGAIERRRIARVLSAAAGSPSFADRGLTAVRLQHQPAATGPHPKSNSARVYLSITTTRDPDLTGVADEAKRLLGMPHGVNEAEVVYGRSPEPEKVTILTRPMMSVLGQLAIQIDVPPDDIVQHRTLPSVGDTGPERRPVVIIHSGASRPADVFTSVR